MLFCTDLFLISKRSHNLLNSFIYFFNSIIESVRSNSLPKCLLLACSMDFSVGIEERLKLPPQRRKRGTFDIKPSLAEDFKHEPRPKRPPTVTRWHRIVTRINKIILILAIPNSLIWMHVVQITLDIFFPLRQNNCIRCSYLQYLFSRKVTVITVNQFPLRSDSGIYELYFLFYLRDNVLWLVLSLMFWKCELVGTIFKE